MAAGQTESGDGAAGQAAAADRPALAERVSAARPVPLRVVLHPSGQAVRTGAPEAVSGASGPPPLVIAHGLFGSARNWNVIARRLADTRPVMAVDMRNHGASPWARSHGYEEMAADLAALIEAHGGQADVLGHSMGGKAAMVLALARPELVRRLIVADIAPVAYDHSQLEPIEAMRAVDLEAVQRRADADAGLARHIDDPAMRAFLTQSLDLEGRRWRLNLDVLAREMDRIIGFPDPGEDALFPGPALFLAGGRSDYVRPEHRGLIRRLFPRALIARIPDAGHWLHAEQPRAFEAAVRAFLDAESPRPPAGG